MPIALCFESGCALAKTGSGFVPPEIGSRYASSRLLLIGESPGAAEAQEGLPFRPYAQSGSLLADAMREVNISRSEVAIYNILACRPPKDYLEGAPYAYSAISHCTENYLRQVIAELKPRAIVALGGTAYRTLASAPKGKYGTLDYARGFVHEGAGVAGGVPVIASYHPSFLRRGASHLTPLLQRDLRRGFLLATGKLVEGRHFSTRLTDLNLAYQTSPTIDEAWAFAESVDPALPLAFDIETPMSTRSDEDERTAFTDRDIKLIQFCQQRGNGIALPYRDEFREVAAKVLSRANVKVGFNNWNFDDPVLAANGIDVGVTEDAMVLYSTYWSDLPHNLQSAAQMCGWAFPWKSLGESDLEFYGCCDVDSTLCIYDYMTKLLAGIEIDAA